MTFSKTALATKTNNDRLNRNISDTYASYSQYLNYISKGHNEVLSIRSNTIKLYDKAGSHNSIFRGKDITSKYLDGSIYTSISNGTFDDLYIGDYFIANINGSDVTCRIAGFDIYSVNGDSAWKHHHAVIVPDEPLMTAPMNYTDTTSGGYANSKMHTVTIPTIDGYLRDAFGNHLTKLTCTISSSIDDGTTNKMLKMLYGVVTEFIDVNGYSYLMSEIELFGTQIYSSSIEEIGNRSQFPLFRLAPEFINKNNYDYWLRNIASNQYYVIIKVGVAKTEFASFDNCVRPFWLIG